MVCVTPSQWPRDQQQWAVCRQMRADPDLQTTPNIITAMADPKLSVKGLSAGATLAMHQPLETQRVLDIITTALALKLKPPTAA